MRPTAQSSPAACPAAADDALFTAAVLTAYAYWLIETTTVALATLPVGDSLWGISTIGERLASRAESFAELADETGRYVALAKLCCRLVETLGLTEARARVSASDPFWSPVSVSRVVPLVEDPPCRRLHEWETALP